MRDRVSGIFALVAWASAGCGTLDDLWPDPEISNCGGRMINTWVDETACGDCPPPYGTGVVCADGVECVRGFCDYRSAMHCGVENRACMNGSTCIAVPEGVDAGLPPHGPVVDGDWCNFTDQYVCGFACTLTDGGVGDEGRGEKDGGVEPPQDPEPEAPVERHRARPSWFTLIGQTPGCRGEGGDARCHTGSIEVTDICGETCAVTFDEDIEVMATELSRAQYRAAMCDCERIIGEDCADVCADRSRDGLPMTGLTWCRAHETCITLGGRLPTALDLARIERASGVGLDLTTGMPICREWRDTIGTAPWIAECVDGRDDFALDAVEGIAGALPIGADVLDVPLVLHHYYGNSREWQAETLDGLTCDAILAGQGVEGDPYAPRVARSRSVFSATGEPVGRLAALSPRTRAADLGMRCIRPARTSAAILPRDAVEPAVCKPAGPLGLRPVRRAVGVPVYTAVRGCALLADAPAGEGVVLASIASEMAASTTPVTLYDDGSMTYLGRAWVDLDEQWWVDPPAVSVDVPTESAAPVLVQLANRPLVLLDLLGERPLASIGESTACGARMEAMDGSPSNGRQLRAFDFAISAEMVAVLHDWLPPDEAHALACRQLACVDEAVDAASCPSGCRAWRLPVLLDLEQIEPRRHSREVCASAMTR